VVNTIAEEVSSHTLVLLSVFYRVVLLPAFSCHHVLNTIVEDLIKVFVNEYSSHTLKKAHLQ